MKKTTIKMDNFKLLTVTTILAILFGFGDSRLVTVPSNTVAVVGQTAYLNCSTSYENPKIHWNYYNDYVYAGGSLFKPYSKFRIEIDKLNRSCNLVIPNVTREDAGRYICLDNEGSEGEERKSAELVVLDANPVCSSNMKTGGIVGPNNCNIEPEEVHLSCNVTYKGDILPVLKWTRLGDSSPISTGRSPISTGRTVCRNSTNTLYCELTIRADHLRLDGSSYICHPEQTTNINCTSDAIDIIYSFDDFRVTERSINDELRCKANSSEECRNRWVWNAFDGSNVVRLDQSNVTANLSGIYRCESECSIRGKQCAVSAMLVYIPKSENKTAACTGQMMESLESETSSSTVSHTTVLTIVLVVLAVLLTLCVVILLIVCIRRRKPKEKLKDSEVGTGMSPLLTGTENNHGERNGANGDQTTGSDDYDEADGKELMDGTTTSGDDLSKLQIENETLRKNLRSNIETIKKLTKDLTDRENEWTKTKAELSSEVDVLKKRLEESERKKEALVKDVKRLIERNSELGRSLFLPPKDPIEYKVEPHEVITTLASQGPKNPGVCGVAVLDNEMFVISDQEKNVEVYDMSTFKHSRNILLRGIIDPGDIVACKESKRIYIVDWTSRKLENKLLRLKANGEEDMMRMSIADDECRLFITRDSNVLVTFHLSRTIVEYTLDSTQNLEKVFQLKIRGDSMHPIHSVKLSNGLLVICFAKKNEHTCRVCIIDDGGRPLKSFGGQRGAGFGQVNFPTYLAVDRSDNVFVTDRNNGRVLLLNSRLEQTAELVAMKDKLRRPRALVLDEINSRLVVADCNNTEKLLDGKVLIFNLK